MTPRAVLFDFGGTLFSYLALGGNTTEMMVDAGRRLGLEPDPAQLAQAYLVGSRAAYERFMAEPFYLHRELFRETFRGMAEHLGQAATPEFLDWFHERQRVTLLEQFVLREGCVETLAALREHGLHVGIVSNIDDDYLVPMLARVGLNDVLDDVLSSEQARSCKPDSRIYELALERAGCRAEEAYFIGDSLEQDIAGAQHVGLKTVLIHEPDGAPPGAGVGAAGTPDHRVTRLADLIPLILAK